MGALKQSICQNHYILKWQSSAIDITNFDKIGNVKWRYKFKRLLKIDANSKFVNRNLVVKIIIAQKMHSDSIIMKYFTLTDWL
ncbi:hypothetical protein C9426_02060 [Serratia sp. S1B]|nr:hypothetical protein C9426_02060 [Serratia sp. S1B]